MFMYTVTCKKLLGAGGHIFAMSPLPPGPVPHITDPMEFIALASARRVHNASGFKLKCLGVGYFRTT